MTGSSAGTSPRPPTHAWLLSPGDRFPVDVPPADGPDPATFENAAAAFEWFDTERPNLVANARSALDAGLPRRAWELAMVLSPIHAQHFTFDDWSVLSEIAVTAAEDHWMTRQRSPLRWTTGEDSCSGAGCTCRSPGDPLHGRWPSARKSETSRGICRSLNALGLIGLRTRELSEASAYFAATAERARQIGDCALGRPGTHEPGGSAT